jgi:hypothetical protein
MNSHSCNCIGPRNGEPLCPCAMRGVEIKDGRYVMPARDLGPVTPSYTSPEVPFGRLLSGTSHPIPTELMPSNGWPYPPPTTATSFRA